ncbi:MAG TPA: hypothetical protein DCE56_22270 [Cyanobacteria bacterium UBA8553]|nr:hypothetical protein [Cyanobacteria bacterium UBA8553]
MSSLFFVLLAIALGAAFFSLIVTEEIYRLMALIVAVSCLIVNLAVAPWTIQVLILLFILFGNRKRFLLNQR